MKLSEQQVFMTVKQDRLQSNEEGKIQNLQTAESNTKQFITHLPQWLACAYVDFSIPLWKKKGFQLFAAFFGFRECHTGMIVSTRL